MEKQAENGEIFDVLPNCCQSTLETVCRTSLSNDVTDNWIATNDVLKHMQKLVLRNFVKKLQANP